ncbi:MAG: ABC transporter permease, partial [Planctomycetes bacterium]|nr:ABC transporter permease [Planctomycetota bacterium]
QSFVRIRQTDIGLTSEHVLTVGIDLDIARRKYSGSDQDVYDQIREKLETMPGVLSIAGAGENPLVASGWTDAIAVVGQPVSAYGELRTAEVRVATPEMFHTLGILFLRGRDFTEHDTPKAAPVAIVSREFARRFLGEQDPLQQSFKFRGLGQPLTVVGVVGDVRPLGMNKEVRPEVYLPYRQSIFMGGDLGPILIVRAVGEPRQVLEMMRQRVEGANSAGRMLVNFRTADQILGAAVSSERFQTMLLGFFAATALLLATIGVYGVMSYTTSQRTHEIGVRMALGAQPRDVLLLIVGRGLLLAICGVAIGSGLSLLLGRVTSSLLYGMLSIAPATVIGVAVCLVVAAGLACLVPARRAMSLDPMMALRNE